MSNIIWRITVQLGNMTSQKSLKKTKWIAESVIYNKQKYFLNILKEET